VYSACTGDIFLDGETCGEFWNILLLAQIILAIKWVMGWLPVAKA